MRKHSVQNTLNIENYAPKTTDKEYIVGEALPGEVE